jgi:Biotin-requiring enzyme
MRETAVTMIPTCAVLGRVARGALAAASRWGVAGVEQSGSDNLLWHASKQQQGILLRHNSQQHCRLAQHHARQQGGGWETLPPGVLLLPMPALSPHMSSGAVSRWLVQPGDTVERYQLIAELDTDSLVEPAYAVGTFAGRLTMLLESQEDVRLAAVLTPEGTEVAVGAPIAVLLDDSDAHGLDVAAAGAAGTAVAAHWSSLYADAHNGAPAPRLLEWQCYLKDSGEEKRPGAGAGGCM